MGVTILTGPLSTGQDASEPGTAAIVLYGGTEATEDRRTAIGESTPAVLRVLCGLCASV
jgi:hypothetical protein